MKIKVAIANLEQVQLVIALVDPEFIGLAGDYIIQRLAPFFPRLPIMLVSVSDNGFRAHAHFHTHRFLALLQLEEMDFEEVDLEFPPPPPDEPLPF